MTFLMQLPGVDRIGSPSGAKGTLKCNYCYGSQLGTLSWITTWALCNHLSP